MIDYYYECLQKMQESVSEKKAIKSSMINLLAHMLKLKYQNDYPYKKSWVDSINDSFDNILIQFKDLGKGSLYKTFYLRQLELTNLYKAAIKNAATETGLPFKSFPQECEWSKEQLMNAEFISDFIKKYYNKNK